MEHIDTTIENICKFINNDIENGATEFTVDMIKALAELVTARAM